MWKLFIRKTLSLYFLYMHYSSDSVFQKDSASFCIFERWRKRPKSSVLEEWKWDTWSLGMLLRISKHFLVSHSFFLLWRAKHIGCLVCSCYLLWGANRVHQNANRNSGLKLYPILTLLPLRALHGSALRIGLTSLPGGTHGKLPSTHSKQDLQKHSPLWCHASVARDVWQGQKAQDLGRFHKKQCFPVSIFLWSTTPLVGAEGNSVLVISMIFTSKNACNLPSTDIHTNQVNHIISAITDMYRQTFYMQWAP